MFFALQAAACQRIVRGAFAGAHQSDQRAGRGGILDHAAPRFGEADHLAHPVGDDFLQLGQRRAGLPGQTEHAQAGAEVIAQHRGELAVGRKVAEEVRDVENGRDPAR